MKLAIPKNHLGCQEIIYLRLKPAVSHVYIGPKVTSQSDL